MIPQEKKRKRPFGAAIGLGREKAHVIENLSVLVDAGITITEALYTLERDVKTPGMKYFLGTVADAVSDGEALWRALGKTKLFSPHVVSLIRIGEESGQLSSNLRIVAETETRRRELRSQIQSALMYPLFVVGVTVIVALGVSWFILPRLITVFSRLNVELPLVTQWLIVFAGFLKEYGMIAVPGAIVALILLVCILFVFKKTKFLGQNILFFLPGSRTLVREVEVSRFSFFLGTLLKAGIPISVALKLLVSVTTFRVYRKFFAHVSEAVIAGDSFEIAFRSYKRINTLVPIPVQQMIFAAERSGSLSENFLHIGNLYEKKIAVTSKNLMALLEPVLLVIIWLAVVGIALAVILPIYGLLSGINRNAPQAPPPTPVEVPVVENYDPFEGLKQVEVVENTPFLRVREEPSVDSIELFKIYPGEVYYFTQFANGWYELRFEDGDSGWVFGEYVSE